MKNDLLVRQWLNKQSKPELEDNLYQVINLLTHQGEETCSFSRGWNQGRQAILDILNLPQ